MDPVTHSHYYLDLFKCTPSQPRSSLHTDCERKGSPRGASRDALSTGASFCAGPHENDSLYASIVSPSVSPIVRKAENKPLSSRHPRASSSTGFRTSSASKQSYLLSLLAQEVEEDERTRFMQPRSDFIGRQETWETKRKEKLLEKQREKLQKAEEHQRQIEEEQRHILQSTGKVSPERAQQFYARQLAWLEENEKRLERRRAQHACVEEKELQRSNLKVSDVSLHLLRHRKERKTMEAAKVPADDTEVKMSKRKVARAKHTHATFLKRAEADARRRKEMLDESLQKENGDPQAKSKHCKLTREEEERLMSRLAGVAERGNCLSAEARKGETCQQLSKLRLWDERDQDFYAPTFAPQIHPGVGTRGGSSSPLSACVSSRRGNDPPPSETPQKTAKPVSPRSVDRFLALQQVREEARQARIKTLQSEHEAWRQEQERKACTFKPEILPASAAIADQRSEATLGFLELPSTSLSSRLLKKLEVVDKGTAATGISMDELDRHRRQLYSADIQDIRLAASRKKVSREKRAPASSTPRILPFPVGSEVSRSPLRTSAALVCTEKSNGVAWPLMEHCHSECGAFSESSNGMDEEQHEEEGEECSPPGSEKGKKSTGDVDARIPNLLEDSSSTNSGEEEGAGVHRSSQTTLGRLLQCVEDEMARDDYHSSQPPIVSHTDVQVVPSLRKGQPAAQQEPRHDIASPTASGVSRNAVERCDDHSGKMDAPRLHTHTVKVLNEHPHESCVPPLLSPLPESSSVFPVLHRAELATPAQRAQSAAADTEAMTLLASWWKSLVSTFPRGEEEEIKMSGRVDEAPSFECVLPLSYALDALQQLLLSSERTKRLPGSHGECRYPKIVALTPTHYKNSKWERLLQIYLVHSKVEEDCVYQTILTEDRREGVANSFLLMSTNIRFYEFMELYEWLCARVSTEVG